MTPPFLFVVGCGRSGTSVLRRVLDQHPDLAVAHEARFVYPLSRRRARYERAAGFDVDAFAADLLADRAVTGNLELGPDDVGAALAGPPIVDYPDAVRRVFAHWAAIRGKSRYGDKMPAYVQHIPVLADLFPESRFVHIIRDGRDVALSAMAMPGARQDVVAAALDWRQRVTAGRRDGTALEPGRYHEVRYEQLVGDPGPVVDWLCAFLGLAPDAAMLRFAERHDEVPDKLRTNPLHTRLAEPLSPAATSWRERMAPADVAAFESVSGRLLTELGYERRVQPPGARARAAGAVGSARWQSRRLRARLPGLVRRAGLRRS